MRNKGDRNRILLCILNMSKEILGRLPKVVGIDIVEMALWERYVMGIGEAEAFSERLKRELLALEAANVHALVECESIIEEDKAPYVAKAAKLKTEYTKN
ncbi:hypothetical protein ZIOFF_060421 [Zingiber officinale]|uniref:Uncharacterized protein n=1 Tax=Zingiber officinale TaxID=94328 RepID=A0A8J5FAR8_ZINOF|nr:hypothetical protein ZIOFF_060421 [Zingiber officinale]